MPLVSVRLLLDQQGPQGDVRNGLISILRVSDSDKKENKQMLTNMGGTATPYFYSIKTNRNFTGLEKSAQNLYKIVSQKENFINESQEKVKDLDIIIYSSPNCPYCMKLKKMLHDEGMMDYVSFIEDMSKMENLEKIQGFPYLMSKKNSKDMTGCPNNINMLLEKLSIDSKGRTQL